MYSQDYTSKMRKSITLNEHGSMLDVTNQNTTPARSKTRRRAISATQVELIKARKYRLRIKYFIQRMLHR